VLLHINTQAITETINSGSQIKWLRITAGCWWITPVILATQEAEIIRITVQSQPQANSLKDLTLKIDNTKQGWRSDSSSIVPA
jgi:hypothetical protein